MGSTDSDQPSSGSLNYMSCCDTTDNGAPTWVPKIFLNGQGNRNSVISNGNEGLMLNLDASTQTQLKGRKGLTGFIASVLLLPLLIPISVIFMIFSQFYNKLTSFKEEYAEPPPIDTGYRCKRHSICVPSTDNPLDMLRHDMREQLHQNGSTGDLRFDIRPELLDTATPLSRSRRGSFSSRRQTLRRNSSVPLIHRQPKYIAPDNLLWQLMMLPILVPLWFLDVFISLVTAPLRVLRRLAAHTMPLEITPPPVRRRGSMSLHTGRPGHKPLVFPVNTGGNNLYTGPPSPHGSQMYLDPSLY